MTGPRWILHHADCRNAARAGAGLSFDCIVCDPPYGLKFMGKAWDHGVPGVEFWRLFLDAAKPGTHLLAFGGTRTFHRLACAIEDAGWELRDTLGWLYGSGFPKSLDVSKAIDKAAGAERETGPVNPSRAGRLVHQQGGHETDGGWSMGNRKVTIDPPATDAAREWSGWGTALKPAWEPIVLARKPLRGTVAENIQQYRVGALNVDACRIPTNSRDLAEAQRLDKYCVRDSTEGVLFPRAKAMRAESNGHGRWPANVIHDGSEEVLELFPQSNRSGFARVIKIHSRGTGCAMALMPADRTTFDHGDTGSAARFFYCAKAARAEREAGLSGPASTVGVWGGEEDDLSEGRGRQIPARNHHPTVKPLALMRYLCRLVCPPGGTVCDPFAGSGSTGVAAILEGFGFIGIEQDRASCDLAAARLAHAAGPVE